MSYDMSWEKRLERVNKAIKAIEAIIEYEMSEYGEFTDDAEMVASLRDSYYSDRETAKYQILKNEEGYPGDDASPEPPHADYWTEG